MAVSGQKQVKYSHRLKMTKKLQNSNFLVNLIRKTKMSLMFTQSKLMELCYAEEQPAKALGGL